MRRTTPHDGKGRPRERAGRGRVLHEALQVLLVLRRGRWTMAELAAELGVYWRTAYRLVEALREAGVTVEVSADQDGDQRPRYYQVPAEPLRKLLRL